MVNSFHHEACKDLPDDLIATAWDRDGLIEGVESKTKGFVVGVQWHPENMAFEHKAMAALFREFIKSSSSLEMNL